MKCMDGNKDHISVLICKFHYFMHPALVVLHTHETSEDTDAVVDMDYVVPYREGRKVVDGQLLALLDRPADADAVETVENLMVGVATDFVFMVYETVVYVLSGNKLGKYGVVLRKYGLESVEMRLLFSVYPDPVATFEGLPYIFGKKFEILVEYRLRGYIELDRIFVLTGKRNIKIYPSETLEHREEALLAIHVR